GIEKNQNLRVNIGGGFAWLFTKDGLSISQMAERMHEYGYIDAPDEASLEESLAEYRGENHSYAYVPEYAEAIEQITGEVTQPELEEATTWAQASEEVQDLSSSILDDMNWHMLLESIAAEDEVLASISARVQNRIEEFEQELGEY